MDIANEIKSLNITLRNKHEAIILALHFIMINYGFKPVGTPESLINMKLPKNWNKNTKSYSIEYTHISTDDQYVLKFVPAKENVIVYASASDQPTNVFSMTIRIQEYTTEAALKNVEDVYTDLDRLSFWFASKIIHEILPDTEPPLVASEKYQLPQIRRDKEMRESPIPKPSQPHYFGKF